MKKIKVAKYDLLNSFSKDTALQRCRCFFGHLEIKSAIWYNQVSQSPRRTCLYNRISRGCLSNEVWVSYSDISSRNDTEDIELVPKTYLAEGCCGQTAMRLERKVYGAIKSRAHCDPTYTGLISWCSSSPFDFYKDDSEKKRKDHLAFQSSPSKHLLMKPTSHSVFISLENIFFCPGGTKTKKRAKNYNLCLWKALGWGFKN